MKAAAGLTSTQRLTGLQSDSSKDLLNGSMTFGAKGSILKSARQQSQLG